MHFFSDNATPICPELLAAIAAADQADHGYDGDAWSARLDGAFSALFDTDVKALWIATGTALFAKGIFRAPQRQPHRHRAKA